MVDYFNFENKDLDFPFYNNNPRISKSKWLLLFIVLFVGLIISGLFSSQTLGAIIGLVIILLGLFYTLDWDYEKIFQKPGRKDVLLAIELFVCYIIYAIIMSSLLDFLSLSSTATNPLGITVTLDTTLSLFPFLMIEELLKFIPFSLALTVIYKFTNNRKLSVIMATLLIIIFFGLLHYTPENTIFSVLLLQGFGSIFEYIGYIKTKNILVCYITHLLTDLLAFTAFIIT
ncbi:MAG: hypothetical protein E7Z84_03640 [Methanosphaera stadtmanae]|nr:hypothetical protein [Methanosphaera stadtmanae]